MRDSAQQKQTDSDVLAHFIDVVGLIQRSTWRTQELKVGITEPANTELPSHEAFVFVAVYFRQLFCDNLLGRAKNTYSKLSPHADRVHEVVSKHRTATTAWTNTPLGLSIAAKVPGSAVAALTTLPTLEDLFDCFTYGAHVLHSHSSQSETARARLGAMLKVIHPHMLLGFLHGGFKEVYGPVSAIGAQVFQDFNELRILRGLPAPNVYWQNQLFNTAKSSNTGG